MKRILKMTFWIQLLIFYVLNIGCANIFSEMADKNTDKALLYETKRQLGKGEWDAAINQINLMSTEYQTRRDVKVLKASAYAGKSGLDFVDLAVALQNGGTSSIFSILLSARSNANLASLNNSILAEDILKGIGTEANRTAEENLLMAFLSLVKVGNILNINGNKDGDTSFDAGWDTCGTLGNSSILSSDATTRADMTEIVTGLGLFLLSMTAAGAGDSAGDEGIREGRRSESHRAGLITRP
jgi:hypothetical protein